MSLSISGALDMPVAETYFLASKARSKLSREASRHDHNLRILVSHANLLDNLMDSLATKRRAVYASKAATATATTITVAPKSILAPQAQAAVSVYEEEEDGYYSSSSDDEEEYFEDYSEGDNEDDDDEEDDEDDEEEEEVQFEPVRIARQTKTFRSLPTVDEDPLDDLDDLDDYQEPSSTPATISATPSNVPTLSYSSEEDSASDSDEMVVPSVAVTEQPARKQSVQVQVPQVEMDESVVIVSV